LPNKGFVDTQLSELKPEVCSPVASRRAPRKKRGSSSLTSIVEGIKARSPVRQQVARAAGGGKTW
jgi:hypothetical protein